MGALWLLVIVYRILKKKKIDRIFSEYLAFFSTFPSVRSMCVCVCVVITANVLILFDRTADHSYTTPCTAYMHYYYYQLKW